MKNSILFTLICVSCWCTAQVGINTTTPNAQLDIQSSNQVLPSNTDGLLIPKVDAFPATNPAAAQQGMLVYLTTTVGTNIPGFYYWNNPTTTWIPIGNNNNSGWNLTGNSGINSTHFIGTTDNANIIFKRNNIFSGGFGSSNLSFGIDSRTLGNGPDNTAIGIDALRTNTGQSNTALGRNALGSNNSGSRNVAVGRSALLSSSGSENTAVGYNASLTVLTGNENSSFGAFARANGGTNSTAIGAKSFVEAANSLVLGSINGVNGATSDVNVGIGTTTPQNKLHVIGNIRMVDGNEAAGNIMISDANGTANWTDKASVSSGTLDEAYDFGGEGNGRTITADTGAVLIDGTDGLVSTGTLNSGAIAPSGAGVKMFWNPRKAAFRAGSVSGTEWNDASIGFVSTAFGNNNIASGARSFAFGSETIASVLCSTAFGVLTNASGFASTAFGNNNIASGAFSTVFGSDSTTSGSLSTAFGNSNSATSYAETVIGIGATTYTPSTNGNSQFRTANVTDRLFVVGNAIDANNNGSVDISERSDALIVLKNGLTRLPSTINTMIDAADGKAVVTKEWTQANAWNITGNFGTNSTNNFVGTTDNQSLIFRTNNTERMHILNTGNVGIGSTNPTRRLQISDNSTSTTNGQLYLEQGGTGDALLHIGNTGGRHFNIGLDTSADSFKISTSATAATAVTTGTLMTILSTEEVGLGTTTPDRHLEVEGANDQYARITATGGTNISGIELKRNSGDDWQIRNETGILRFGQSTDNLATVTDVLLLGGGSVVPGADNFVTLGQTNRRWTQVCAINGTIQTSDLREKQNIEPLEYGLSKVMSLKPVTFKWINNKIDNHSKHIGFIAQDLQKIIPEVVIDHEWQQNNESETTLWKETERLGVNYAEVIPILVKSIQEQQTQIEELKAKIEKLENK